MISINMSNSRSDHKIEISLHKKKLNKTMEVNSAKRWKEKINKK